MSAYSLLVRINIPKINGKLKRIFLQKKKSLQLKIKLLENLVTLNKHIQISWHIKTMPVNNILTVSEKNNIYILYILSKKHNSWSINRRNVANIIFNYYKKLQTVLSEQLKIYKLN